MTPFPPEISPGPAGTPSLAQWPEGWASIVLVPVDGSPAGLAALTVARNLARVMGSMVHLVHVTDAPLSDAEMLQQLGLRKTDLHGAVLDRLQGEPAGAVTSAAARLKAELVVIGTSASPEQAEPSIGPVAEGVALRSPSPVLLVRSGARGRLAQMPGRLLRLLLPLEGAPSSAEVLGPALALAARSNAQLDVLHVAGSGIRRPAEAGTLTAPRYVDQPQHEWPAWAQEFLDRFCSVLTRCPINVPTRLSVSTGAPGPSILEFAAQHESDLIVLEWRDAMRLDHGGVVRFVVANALCPVLLLRAAEAHHSR